ncbi:related to RNase III domain [Lecanosticta acicola]|uniref:Related to RNase III domain n=1 Tax=Lecanosticta acicola TaxID=111012 RepID=A0AAI8YZ44_9PEZI|nr:related to RNase III domain [Lecanosticta acicola]
MPYRLRPVPKQPTWKANEDDEKLYAMYDRLLDKIGPPEQLGRELLDEDTRWLAITHKSFDHGRRGFNDRLAFLGKRIVDLQTSLALLSMPSPPVSLPSDHVFRHPSLEGADNITAFTKAQVLDKRRLADLARKFGIQRVIRWKPRRSDDLETSGVDVVLAHTLYSIVGALALHKGGEVAAKTAREKILRPLGLRF